MATHETQEVVPSIKTGLVVLGPPGTVGPAYHLQTSDTCEHAKPQRDTTSCTAATKGYFQCWLKWGLVFQVFYC